MRAAVPPVLLPGRHPEPRRARDAGLDPRGRRARLRARCTPTAPPSTTPTCSSCASSATARRRPGPLAASWHSNKFLNPARDGAVLPILHLNGYKIANPTVLARIPREELEALLDGYGYAPRFVEGDDPAAMHQLMAATLDEVARRDRRDPARRPRARRSDAPALADDRAAHAEGLDRPQARRRPAGGGLVPLAPGAARGGARRPRAPRAARGVDALLPPGGAVRRGRARCGPSSPRSPRRASGAWAPTRTPTAACCCATSSCPTSATTRVDGAARRARRRARRRACSGGFLRDVIRRNPEQLPHHGTRRDRLEPARRRVRGDRPRAGRRRRSTATITSRPTAA